MRTLAVVGAGPKGLAIAAKARALAEAGADVPRVVLIERGEVASNWTGEAGYTNGLLPLGTAPEKDVGYPYPQSWGALTPRINAAMARFSWQTFLIERGSYADWVDRGRLSPTHRQWSAYLRAVAAACRADIVRGEVTGLETAAERDGPVVNQDSPAGNQDSPAGNQDSPAGERWRINLADGRVLEADGVVITGMGPPVRLARQPAEHPRVLDGRTYWLHDRDLGAGAAKSFCVIGGGETAASVVMSLVTGCHPHSTIDVLTSRGVIYSRGESYDENRLYSDPGEWPLLTEAHRREFLERTDRGVVSLQAEEILNQAAGLRTVPGTAVAIEASDHQAVVTVEYGQERERVAYDTVIVATGFDEHWFERLLGERARQHLDNARAGDELERCIDVSLSVDGMTPALHLPVMAGLAQGPGFPNLTCLGLLSDRVLRRYVPVSPPASLVTEGSQRA